MHHSEKPNHSSLIRKWRRLRSYVDVGRDIFERRHTRLSQSAKNKRHFSSVTDSRGGDGDEGGSPVHRWIAVEMLGVELTRTTSARNPRWYTREPSRCNGANFYRETRISKRDETRRVRPRCLKAQICQGALMLFTSLCRAFFLESKIYIWTLYNINFSLCR